MQKVDNLCIVGICRIKITDWQNDRPVYKTIGDCPDTPRHIADLIDKNKIKGSYWVFRPGGEKTLETIKNGLSVKM
jgi:hypothetical protein